MGADMNSALATVLISGATSIVSAYGVVALSHFYGRKRDHEADWRKMKLDHYKEYAGALSGIVHNGNDVDAKRRYADACNSLDLVAPNDVLIALYAFLDETSISNNNRSDEKYELLVSNLFRKMRLDCHPSTPNDPADFTFRTINIPLAVNKKVNT
jgi:hypothetical protein